MESHCNVLYKTDVVPLTLVDANNRRQAGSDHQLGSLKQNYFLRG